ncbi:hypothetical protein CCOS865_02102 [Pseudomonas reidholzensis]|uniref:Uncharacterized protein n=1 Tax=Pseudomonas reidholzensis TaxID=1785162 RepID=A0A383RS00_9PSED|nr:hypothetical protein CCOS865_02102 [Pseudomonas reidholzensis]
MVIIGLADKCVNFISGEVYAYIAILPIIILDDHIDLHPPFKFALERRDRYFRRIELPYKFFARYVPPILSLPRQNEVPRKLGPLVDINDMS